MAKYSVVKRACEGCSISFNPKSIICQDCDPARFRFCFLGRDRVLHEGVKKKHGDFYTS